MKATVTDITKRISVSLNRTDGILNYDIDNAYPQRIIDIVNSSGSATACVGMKARFLIGGGMTEKTFYKSQINKSGTTVDQLLRKLAVNKSLLPYIVIHVNYNALFEPVEVNYVPFQYARLTTKDDKDHPDMIAIYRDWQRIENKKIDKKKIDFLHFYDRNPEVIQEQVDEAGGWEYYKGQVFLWTPEGHEYPLSTFDSVLEDMQTDSKAKTFKFRNITTNFMASHLIITNKFEKDEDLELFHENLQQFQGADDALKFFHLEKETDNDNIELKKIEIQDVEKLYEFTESSVRENIILNFLIPPVLILRNSGNAFSDSQIEQATALFNGYTADDRLVLEEIFKEIFTGFAENINPSGDYSIIPFKAPVAESQIGADYLKYFTANEVRESLGYPPEESKAAETKPLYEALGVGGLQALKEILIDTTLTEDQKINTLEIIFQITHENAVKLVTKQTTTA